MTKTVEMRQEARLLDHVNAHLEKPCPPTQREWNYLRQTYRGVPARAAERLLDAAMKMEGSAS